MPTARSCLPTQQPPRLRVPRPLRRRGTEVVPQSTVDGDVVTGPDGQTIGTLQPDGKTVADSEGNVVGVRSADGAVVATPLSGVPVDDVVATESTAR